MSLSLTILLSGLNDCHIDKWACLVVAIAAPSYVLTYR